jgi:hypothetical protein
MFGRGCVAALAWCWCAWATATPYPTEAQLRTAIRHAEVFAQAEGLEVEVLDAEKEGVTRPLMAAGLSLHRQSCLVFYNTKPLSELEEFFAGFTERDLSIWLDAIAVHEMAHCVEQREAYVRRHFDKVLPPGYSRDNVTVQSYLAVVKSGAVENWGEALADLAAVLYLRQAVPNEWQRFATGLAEMREHFASKYPVHDTSPWLRKAIAAQISRRPGQTLFEAAFEYRLQFDGQQTVAKGATETRAENRAPNHPEALQGVNGFR